MTRTRRTHLARPLALVMVLGSGTAALAADPGNVLFEGDPQADQRIQDLLDEWGQTCPRYDLDGDGIVGTADLLDLLMRMSNGADPPVDFNVIAPGPEAFIVETGSGPPTGFIAIPAPGDSGDAGDGGGSIDHVEALLSEWNEQCPRNDFTGDGVVGTADLLALLAIMSEERQDAPEAFNRYSVVSIQEAPAPSPAPAPDGRTYTRADLEALLAEWGQTCPRYDLDGDGIVGTADLLALLARMSHDRSVDRSSLQIIGGVVYAFDVGDASKRSPVTDLLDAWGQTCPRYDLNGDGVVSTADLMIVLAGM